MTFDEITLPNGLRIIGEQIADYRSVSVGLWVESGSQYEVPALGGVSHFIEHMLFKGTHKRSARDIADEMDAVGGQINAFTSKECTCFYAKVVGDQLPLAMDVLSDLILNSRLDPVDVEKEKGVVLEEIDMAEDSPEDLVFDLMMLAQYGDQPVSRPILGTRETVSALNDAEIRKYMARMYRPECAVLALAGSYDWEMVKQLALELLGGWQPTGEPRPQIVTNPTPPKILRRKKDIEQTHLCIGYPSVGIGSDELYALTLFNSVYGGAMSSRLFQAIREDKGMVYTVYSYPNSYMGTGVLAVYAGASPEKAEQVIRLIDAETKCLIEEGLTPAEFERAKKQLLAGYILGLESTSNRMNALGRRKLLLGSVQTDEMVIAKINSVSFEDANALMRRILGAPASMALVGNKADDIATGLD